MPCPLCHDSYWVTDAVEGVERVRRCDCWRATMTGHQLAQARIPRGYLHCELANFEQTVDSLREAHRRARAFIDAFPAVDRGLLLHGRHGVGKTHLAVAVLKEIVRTKGGRGYFYETRELLKLVRDTYATSGETTEMDVLRPVLEADLLVLDDLGAEKTSEWVQETLGLVVNTRYSERRPTLFTTNLEDSADPTDMNSMLVRLGARIRSRLFEMCHWVHMDGLDVREVGLHPTPDDIARYQRESPESDRHRRPGGFPEKTKGTARASLRQRGPSDVAWSGGKGGSG